MPRTVRVVGLTFVVLLAAFNQTEQGRQQGLSLFISHIPACF